MKNKGVSKLFRVFSYIVMLVYFLIYAFLVISFFIALFNYFINYVVKLNDILLPLGLVCLMTIPYVLHYISFKKNNTKLYNISIIYQFVVAVFLIVAFFVVLLPKIKKSVSRTDCDVVTPDGIVHQWSDCSK